MNICDRKIADLVGENHVYASVLYYFGIRFYDYSEQTLAQACGACGLKTASVIHELESATRSIAPAVPLTTLPIDLVVAYLRHAHFGFVKQRMPYLSHLVQFIEPRHTPLAKDLQLLFPLFVEDFIHHIYQEEDTLFGYVALLHQAAQGKPYCHGKLHYAMEKHAIGRFAQAHDTHDDEMAGIRELTSNYAVHLHTSLHLRVLFAELKDFERELRTHAAVENDILFPKALALEQEVKERLAANIACQ